MCCSRGPPAHTPSRSLALSYSPPPPPGSPLTDAQGQARSGSVQGPLRAVAHSSVASCSSPDLHALGSAFIRGPGEVSRPARCPTANCQSSELSSSAARRRSWWTHPRLAPHRTWGRVPPSLLPPPCPPGPPGHSSWLFPASRSAWEMDARGQEVPWFWGAPEGQECSSSLV